MGGEYERNRVGRTDGGRTEGGQTDGRRPAAASYFNISKQRAKGPRVGPPDANTGSYSNAPQNSWTRPHAVRRLGTVAQAPAMQVAYSV